MPKKVYELADELNMGALDLVKVLNDMGVQVRNHMASLSDKEVSEFKTRYGNPVLNQTGTIYLILGFKAKVETLQSKFSTIGKVEVVDLNISLIHDQACSYYFVTNFKNMLTSYEKDFLFKHDFVKNIIACDPDFDEYEDLATDLKSKYPFKRLLIYDERAFSVSASTAFSKDQIDFLHCVVSTVVSEEVARKATAQITSSLDKFSVEASVIGKDLLKKCGQHLNEHSTIVFDRIKNLYLDKPIDDTDNLRKTFLEERESLANKTTSQIVTWRIVSAVFLVVTVCFDFLYFYNANKDLSLYLQSHLINLISYLAVFSAFQYALTIASTLKNDLINHIRSQEVEFLSKYLSSINKSQSDFTTVEEYKKRIAVEEKKFKTECVDFPEKIDVLKSMEDKKRERLHRLNKKAA